jgi:hypothetical protein
VLLVLGFGTMRTKRRAGLLDWVALAGSAVLFASGLVLQVQAASPTPHPPASASPEFVRGAYGKDASSLGFDVMVANGFNSVMTGPYKELLDPLKARGIKGVVWLGAYRNAPTCSFERNDAQITTQVRAITGHPAILAYFLGDEPHVSDCPVAPAMFKQRSDLVHSLDPGSTTFTVIQASENGVAHDYAPWAGVVDVIGFDVYPCARAKTTCDFGAIDAAVNAIEAAGIKRYWAVVQDFQDCYYRLPTSQELRAQFDHWARSNMSGYFVFSWNYQPADSRCVGATLGSHPDNVAELKYENAVTFTPAGLAAVHPPSGVGAFSNLRLLAVLLAAAVLVLVAGLTIQARRRRR